MLRRQWKRESAWSFGFIIFLCSFYRQIRLEMISLGREVRFGRSVVEEKVSEGFSAVYDWR